MTTMIRACAAAAAMFMVGCGGGGGGPAPIEVPQGVRSVAASAGSDVTASSLNTFSGPLARAVMSISSNGVVGTVAGGRESPQAATGARAALPAPARWALAVAGSSTRPSGREQAQEVSPENIDCPFGGSMTISVNDADNNQELSAGDSVSITAFSCTLEATLPMANGGFAMTINAVELDSDDEPTALDATASFSNFALAGFGSMNGGFRLWTKTEGASERIRINYQALAVTEGAQTVTYDFDAYGLMSANGGSFDLNGGLRLNGQTYSLVGGDVFSFSGDNPPGVGSLRLIDAAGDALKLSARSASTLDLEFFPAGSASATASLLGQPWSSFRQ